MALLFTSEASFCYLGLLTSLPSGSYLCQIMRHRGHGEVCACWCVFAPQPFNRTAHHSSAPASAAPCRPSAFVLLSFQTKTPRCSESKWLSSKTMLCSDASLSGVSLHSSLLSDTGMRNENPAANVDPCMFISFFRRVTSTLWPMKHSKQVSKPAAICMNTSASTIISFAVQTGDPDQLKFGRWLICRNVRYGRWWLFFAWMAPEETLIRYASYLRSDFSRRVKEPKGRAQRSWAWYRMLRITMNEIQSWDSFCSVRNDTATGTGPEYWHFWVFNGNITFPTQKSSSVCVRDGT